MLEPTSILGVIPALNEAAALPDVLRRLRAQGITRVRVVDNGSEDGTAEAARDGGAEVVKEPVRGYGMACWRALQELPEDVEWVFFCDADGSDELERLPEFLEAAERHDFVLGDRWSDAAGAATLTLPQRWGNRLATALIRLAWGFAYRDLGPMRLIRRAALERIAMEDRGFGWTIEMQIRAVEEGLRIAEVPVRARERQGGRSKISGTVRGVVSAGTVILATWGKFFLRKARVQGALRVGSAALLLAGAGVMVPFGDFARLGVHPLFWAGAGLMAAGYGLSWGLRGMSWLWLLGLAAGLRAVLLFMFPGDDVWRYLWEGRVLNAGFNPYVLPPSSEVLAPLRTPWWELVGHKEITAIYPPLTQALMRVAALGGDWLLLKLMIAAADLAVVALLAWRLGTGVAARYAWCPLVLVVFAGGAHFDAWMLAAMTASWLLWERGRLRWAALAMGAACGIKYVAAPLLAWMLWRTARRAGWRAAGWGAALAVLPSGLAWLSLPAPWDLRDWLPRDFALYARSADLVPRLVGEVWPDSLRMNPLYLLPAGLAGVWVVLRAPDLPQAATRWFLALLLFSPLVHGWYFTWALPFAAATGHWGWRWAGISALVYFQLQQTAFDRQDWLLSWPQLALLWGPLLLGSWMQMQMTKPK
jgi:glycosyltransferase involved in cell wall biosynthesis